MNKEQQDKIWSELSEESKKIVLNAFSNIDSIFNGKCIDAAGMKHFMSTLFGIYNLNPKPPTPKTWEDFIDNKIFEDIYVTYIKLQNFSLNSGIDNKLRDKVLATYKIWQLIKLSYGGIISEREWRDVDIPKYGIYCGQSGKLNEQTINLETRGKRTFIAFHTPEQREEFMSYASNKRLVEQYYWR